MANRYNLPYFQALFCDFLHAENNSRLTIKNYRSDLKHFTAWYCGQYFPTFAPDQIDSTIYSSLQSEAIKEYVQYLQAHNIPTKTINRRLSTLRKLSAFCLKEGFMTVNPTLEIANVKSTANLENLLSSYITELRSGNIARNVILSDIADFL